MADDRFVLMHNDGSKSFLEVCGNGQIRHRWVTSDEAHSACRDAHNLDKSVKSCLDDKDERTVVLEPVRRRPSLERIAKALFDTDERVIQFAKQVSDSPEPWGDRFQMACDKAFERDEKGWRKDAEARAELMMDSMQRMGDVVLKPTPSMEELSKAFGTPNGLYGKFGNKKIT